jgi:hypothetical protein
MEAQVMVQSHPVHFMILAIYDTITNETGIATLYKTSEYNCGLRRGNYFFSFPFFFFS